MRRNVSGVPAYGPISKHGRTASFDSIRAWRRSASDRSSPAIDAWVNLPRSYSATNASLSHGSSVFAISAANAVACSFVGCVIDGGPLGFEQPAAIATATPRTNVPRTTVLIPRRLRRAAAPPQDQAQGQKPEGQRATPARPGLAATAALVRARAVLVGAGR